MSLGSTVKSFSVHILRKTVFNSPWYLTRKEPIIEIISTGNDGYKINLNVYTLNSSHADFIRQELMTGLDK